MSPSGEEVVVVAIVDVKPGTEERVLATFETAFAATHEKDDGCHLYALHVDRENPTRFVVVERWASMEAIETHNAKDHLAELFEVLGTSVTTPPQIIFTRALPVGDPVKGSLAGAA
jgi:quinol monooxygenase YgiN